MVSKVQPFVRLIDTKADSSICVYPRSSARRVASPKGYRFAYAKAYRDPFPLGDFIIVVCQGMEMQTAVSQNYLLECKLYLEDDEK